MQKTTLKSFIRTIILLLGILMALIIIYNRILDFPIIRLILLTILSIALLIINQKITKRMILLIFDINIASLFCVNVIVDAMDIIKGKNIYNLPEIVKTTPDTIGALIIGILAVCGLYYFLYNQSCKIYENTKKHDNGKNKNILETLKIEPDIILMIIIFYMISLSCIALIHPIYDAFYNKQFDFINLHKHLVNAIVEGCLSFVPFSLFFFTVLKYLKPQKFGDFLITENQTIVKYKGKNKKIYVPKDLSIYLTDTFLECDDTYEIWFEEGIVELPPLKFLKSIPKIHYPTTLENIREYSLFIKDENPFDNNETVKNLLNNSVFKIIDGCMVNTKTQTLLFVIDHKKNELKIPESVKKVGRYAFDDLLLGKCYKLRKTSQYNASENTELLKKYYTFSNGTDLEYLLNEGEATHNRVQLEKIFFHKNVDYIDSYAFEFATGIKEVYVPEDAEYDLTEIISTKSYIKYLGKGKKITHRMIERLLQIHGKIKSGCFPNSKQLAYDLETSEPTINRDIEYLRDSRGAPIEYDHVNRGYYYTEDYELFFDK